jgi:Sulfotransferase domain
MEDTKKSQTWATTGHTKAGKPLAEGLPSALRIIFNPRNVFELPRLLREGLGPIKRLFIQAHNSTEIMRLLKKRERLNFVTSFPRSGNTWARHLLADVFLQNRGFETNTELPLHPDRIVPDFYCDWMAKKNITIPASGVYVKTHDLFEQLKTRFNHPGLSRCKQIYLYRTPEDALVSLFHFYEGHNHHKHKTVGGLDAFCLEHLPAWEAHMESYLTAAEEGLGVFFVPYELLLQYPTEILSNLLRWLGNDHDRATVDRAVSNMQFSKLQALEARDTFKEEVVFFRRGCRGTGQAELQPSTMETIQERGTSLLARANNRVLQQQSLQRNPTSTKTSQIRWQAAIDYKKTKATPIVPSLQRT